MLHSGPNTCLLKEKEVLVHSSCLYKPEAMSIYHTDNRIIFSKDQNLFIYLYPCITKQDWRLLICLIVSIKIITSFLVIQGPVLTLCSTPPFWRALTPFFSFLGIQSRSYLRSCILTNIWRVKVEGGRENTGVEYSNNSPVFV